MLSLQRKRKKEECQFLIGNVRRVCLKGGKLFNQVASERCQFLIGNVRRNAFSLQMLDTTKMCQFLIGNVRPEEAEDTSDDATTLEECQFLIGNVRQPYLSAVAIIILHFFPKINQFSAEKSVDTSFFIS